MKCQLLAPCLSVLCMVACAPGINIIRHPDYNYSPTDPMQMKVYLHGLTPTYPYVIIGKLILTANAFTSRSRSQDLKIFKRAAQMGADGIIMTDMDIDIYAFNQYVTTQGFATLSGNSLSYFQVTRPYASYWVTYIFYGYLIKAT